MKKTFITTLAALALSVTAAHAQAVSVIKDTRQYLPFTNSITGPVGCTMPKDLDRPNLEDAGECRVTRDRLTTSGELLVCDEKRSICSRTVYSGGSRRMGGDLAGEVVPDQSIVNETFKCDASGARTK